MTLLTQHNINKYAILQQQSMTKVRLYALGTSTTLESNKSDLDTYLSVREALGFQMRAARTLLRDFVGFLETRGDAGPIRAQWAIDWACAAATRRGTGSAAQR